MKNCLSLLALVILLLSACSSSTPLKSLAEPIFLTGGTEEKSDGQLYGNITELAKAALPLNIRDFIVLYDDRNLKLENPVCALVDQSNKTLLFDRADVRREPHVRGDDYILDTELITYTCVVIPPAAGQYKFALRYDSRDHYTGEDTVVMYNWFTVEP